VREIVMPTATMQREEEDRIRERMEALAEALRTKEIDVLMAHYAPDMVTFDLRPPAQIRTATAYRKNFEAWFASVEGRIDYEMHDLGIAVGGDTAFCHYQAHVRSKRASGETVDYWVRVTSGLRKMDGRWMIAHEHISMPVDLRTMQAASGR
jgi:ketosteroid isomerase-like protein